MAKNIGLHIVNSAICWFYFLIIAAKSKFKFTTKYYILYNNFWQYKLYLFIQTWSFCFATFKLYSERLLDCCLITVCRNMDRSRHALPWEMDIRTKIRAFVKLKVKWCIQLLKQGIFSCSPNNSSTLSRTAISCSYILSSSSLLSRNITTSHATSILCFWPNYCQSFTPENFLKYNLFKEPVW